MQSVIFHLIGKPGVGKYTVGVELARLTGARLVDSHATANLIFNLIHVDGSSPLPEGVWPRVAQVRAAVFDTLVHVSPRDLSFIFTNYLIGDDEAEYAAFLELAAVAAARESVFVPVILSCETEELVRRIVRPDRRERMKLTDPVRGAELNDGVPQFHTDHPNALQIDITHRPALETAEMIAEWAGRTRGP